MTVVVDANLAVGVAISEQYTPQIIEKFTAWRKEDEHLIAPNLLEYEVVSALQRAISLNLLARQEAERVLRIIFQLGIELVYPTQEVRLDAIRWAERISQSKAYDAQYLALASRENAPLWTADRRLANAAQATGATWVHWIGEKEIE